MVIKNYNPRYGNDNLLPEDMENVNLLLEQVLDKIADKLINSEFVNDKTVSINQKTIKDGVISLGRTNSDRLVLYQKDIKANQEDLITTGNYNFGDKIGHQYNLKDIIINLYQSDFQINQIIINVFTNSNNYINIYLYTDVTNSYDITNLLTDGDNNPINVSQFVNINQQSTLIDPIQANEYLDTNIYELLPDFISRQERVNNLFIELENLLPPTEPTFDLIGDDGGPDGRVDRDEDGNWVGSDNYYYNFSISATQDSTAESLISEEESYITRLANNGGSQNSGKTIEDIYNIITPYLEDIIEDPTDAEDDRPIYENQSNGYLKFRNLNQGIIIRNTNEKFIDGLNPETKDYLSTGFTITMWVKFLDKSSQGTLFNFGNPVKPAHQNPLGFKLETYVLNKDDPCPHPGHSTWGDAELALSGGATKAFKNSNTARYVRLVILDKDDARDGDILRDSHTGMPGAEKFTQIPDFSTGAVDYEEFRLLQTTFIPEDFNEWYFICATFNPNVLEDISYDQVFPACNDVNGVPSCNEDENFWKNHIDESGLQTKTTYGNRCKVEIISKTDLLRARGYKG